MQNTDATVFYNQAMGRSPPSVHRAVRPPAYTVGQLEFEFQHHDMIQERLTGPKPNAGSENPSNFINYFNFD